MKKLLAFLLLGSLLHAAALNLAINQNGLINYGFTAQAGQTFDFTNGTIVFPAITGDLSKVQRVSTVAALRALSIIGLPSGYQVSVGGYYANADGGGGPIRVLSTGQAPSYYTDNGGSIIVPTGGNGSAAWLWQYSGPFNAKWFGAKGDGITDDAASINASLAALPSNGGVVIVTTGIYLIKSSITISTRSTLKGSGSQEQSGTLAASIIKKDSSMTSPAIVVTGASATISSLSINGVAGNAGSGILIIANKCTVQDVSVVGMGSDGIDIGSDSVVYNANSFGLTDVVCSSNSGIGLYISQTGVNANAGTCLRVICTTNGSDGIKVVNAVKNNYIGCLSEGNTGYGLNFSPGSIISQYNTWVGGDCEGNTAGDIIVGANARWNTFVNPNHLGTASFGSYSSVISASESQLSGGLSLTAPVTFGTLSMGLNGTGGASIIDSGSTHGLALTGDLYISGIAAGTNTFMRFANGTNNVALLGTQVSAVGGSATNFVTYIYGTSDYGIYTGNSLAATFSGTDQSLTLTGPLVTSSATAATSVGNGAIHNANLGLSGASGGPGFFGGNWTVAKAISAGAPSTINAGALGADANNGVMKLISASNADYCNLTLWDGATSKNASALNWQISSNYSTFGTLDILRSTTNTGNPTTQVASFNATGETLVGSLALSTVGTTLFVKSGTNGLSGTVTLTAGAGTITSTAIDANTLILLTRVTASGAASYPLVTVGTGSATVAGLATDAGTYNWIAFKYN